MALLKLSHLFCFFMLYSSNILPLISRPVLAQTRPAFACDESNNNFRFCDTTLDVQTRVKDLVSRLTLKDKIKWLVSNATGVSSLGIPNYDWWSEALHGVSGTGPGVNFRGPISGAISFPQPILTAASFNESLFEAIGKVVSTEARAMYNVGQAGLTFWSPNVNIFRDPRWGRGQETPGEDPLLSSKYGVAYVRGLQRRDDGDSEKLKVAACCKHYTAYDLDHWKGVDRFTFNAMVTKQDLEDTFQPPFRSCVLDGNVASVMCSYNQVNGKPSCGDPDLLNGVIRGQWKLNGYIVSDCDAVDVILAFQKFVKTPEEVVALTLNAGMDVDCIFSRNLINDYAESAISKGLLNETVIDRAVSNNFATMMRLGFFDGNPKNQLYGDLGPNDVCSESNQEFAREVARQGIVLLKNSEDSLPLSPKAIKSLAVIGPNANATDTMIGSYAGIPCKYTSPMQGLAASVPEVLYHPGCTNIFCEVAQIDDAKKIASTADAVVLFVGSNQSIEAEGLDRVSITLPGQQQLLVSEVAKVAKGHVVLVIMSGGGMDVQFAKDDPKVTSILWVGFPGEAGGAAIADVIFGRYNPSGRLPMTWYPQSYVDTVDMTDMNMRPVPERGYPGRTYRFYKGSTVFSFGYGLSYTVFSYHRVQAPKEVSIGLDESHVCHVSECKSIDPTEDTCKKLASDFQLRVRNEGTMSGSETVLLFFVLPPQVHNAPQKTLVGFQKLHLAPQGEGLVTFRVDVCENLSVVDENGNRKIALGEHLLQVGNLTHSLSVGI